MRSGSTEPLGLYSKKYKKVSDFPVGSTIAIPNDPTNEGRALILLQAKGLITLKPDAGLEATVRDIVDNPKKFVFKEIESPYANILKTYKGGVVPAFLVGPGREVYSDPRPHLAGRHHPLRNFSG